MNKLVSYALGAVTLVATGIASADEPASGGVRAATATDAPNAGFLSLGLERVGGVAYAAASAKDSNDSVSLFAIGVGGVTLNPYAVPRVGVDYVLPMGLTLGGGLGFTNMSASSKSNNTSTDVGTATLYTITPRVGYRIPLAPSFDLTPRAGATFAGGAFKSGSGNSTQSIFAVALGAEGVGALRLTNSFNFLFGLGIDQTVSASATDESTSGGTNRTTTTDVKGALFSFQAWLGLGGYL